MQESPTGVEKSPSVDLDGQRLTAKTSIESVPINVPSPSGGTPGPPASPLLDSPRKNSKMPVSKIQLTMDMCKGKLSDLGDGLHFRTMCLANLGLDFVGPNILKFKLINNLNLAHNNITSLGKHVGQLENLLKIDVSHNRLTKALDFTSAGMLQHADFSHNRIEDVDNASNHKYLRELNLSHNNIDDIRALSRLKQLKCLNLSHNELRQAEGLDDLPLLKLDLSSNKLQNVFDVLKLKFLLVLDISNNQISDIKPLVKANLPIQDLRLGYNKLANMTEILPLQEIKFLQKLQLIGNPLDKTDDYHQLVLYLFPKLTFFDGTPVEPNDSVRARNLFRPSAELCSSLDHMTHTVYGVLEGQRLREYIMPNPDYPYPFLILTGPPKLNKSSLVKRLVEEFGDAFGHASSHTTAAAAAADMYQQVDDIEFQELIRQGAFIQMARTADGIMFGLTKDYLEKVALEGKAAVCHMNLDGVRTMKLTTLRPRYIVITPRSPESYRAHLEAKGCDDLEIQEAFHRVEQFAIMNREQPGYFDMVIAADSEDETYEILRKLVVEFLGENEVKSAKFRNGSMSSITSTPEQRRRKAEQLIESVRNVDAPFKVQSAPSKMRNSSVHNLLNLIDHEIGSAESEEDWETSSSIPPKTPTKLPAIAKN